jgi:hypothetical protein
MRIAPSLHRLGEDMVSCNLVEEAGEVTSRLPGCCPGTAQVSRAGGSSSAQAESSAQGPIGARNAT